MSKSKAVRRKRPLTALTLLPSSKQAGEWLAREAGLSFSAYVGNLLLTTAKAEGWLGPSKGGRRG